MNLFLLFFSSFWGAPLATHKKLMPGIYQSFRKLQKFTREWTKQNARGVTLVVNKHPQTKSAFFWQWPRRRDSLRARRVWARGRAKTWEKGCFFGGIYRGWPKQFYFSDGKKPPQNSKKRKEKGPFYLLFISRGVLSKKLSNKMFFWFLLELKGEVTSTTETVTPCTTKYAIHPPKNVYPKNL